MLQRTRFVIAESPIPFDCNGRFCSAIRPPCFPIRKDELRCWSNYGVRALKGDHASESGPTGSHQAWRAFRVEKRGSLAGLEGEQDVAGQAAESGIGRRLGGFHQGET